MSDIDAHAIARYDQRFAAVSQTLDTAVADMRVVVAEDGETMAALQLAAAFAAYADVDALVDLVTVAVTRLARTGFAE